MLINTSLKNNLEFELIKYYKIEVMQRSHTTFHFTDTSNFIKVSQLYTQSGLIKINNMDFIQFDN